jgi:hypothetical protein
MTGLFVLVHAGCGHFGGLANDQQLIDDQVRLLRAAGYHQWRCAAVPAGQAPVVIAAIASGERSDCITCRVDPLRGLLPEALRVAGEIEPLGVIRR